MIFTIFALLIIYQLKHFLADYPLQTDFMLGKFKPGWDFLLPLLSHCYVHALGTYLIALTITSDLGFSTLLGLLDGAIHFAMDRLKAGPKYMGRWKAITADEYRHCKEMLRTTYDPIVAKTFPEDVRNWTDQIPRIQQESERKLRGNVLFWWAIGFDQLIHHLTHYLCIYLILHHLGLI